MTSTADYSTKRTSSTERTSSTDSANDPRFSVNWDVTEGAHTGQWTADTTDEGKDVQRFVHYTGAPDQIKVHYVGDQVYVERYKPGDLHFYHGTISADKRTISGRYLISSLPGARDWSAQINY